MAKCKDCQYSSESCMQINMTPLYACTLTNNVVHGEKEHSCDCFNRDLTQFDICYNCKYYGGGGDWGLFCSHQDMYHHIGKFNDDPCEWYERGTG